MHAEPGRRIMMMIMPCWCCVYGKFCGFLQADETCWSRACPSCRPAFQQGGWTMQTNQMWIVIQLSHGWKMLKVIRWCETHIQDYSSPRCRKNDGIHRRMRPSKLRYLKMQSDSLLHHTPFPAAISRNTWIKIQMFLLQRRSMQELNFAHLLSSTWYKY